MSDIRYSGPGFLTLLGLLFIGLKLGSVITWSWWWVLLPIYGPFALGFGLVALVLSGALVIGALATVLALVRK